MKKLNLMLIMFFPVFILAQNWSPILVNQKMNYQHSDSNYISHTMWVDSAFYFDDDSIFYFNRVVKDIPGNPEIALRNQPQFLSKFITKQHYEDYTFYICAYPFNYFLMPTFGLGYDWSFTNNINAEITSILWQDVFGVMDSVKIVSLSDGNEIHFSKNFGILKFPDLENGGNFNLVGIQDTEYGQSVPGFWEVYDFEVGDVFQYSEYFENVDYTVYATRKIEITEKDITGNIVNYNYEGVYSAFGYNNKGWIAYPISGELIFTYSDNHPANKFQSQIYVLPNSQSTYGTNRVLTFANVVFDIETDVTHKHYGSKEESYVPYEKDVFYELYENSDTLFRFETVGLILLPCGMMGIGYGNTIGNTYNSGGCFEIMGTKELVGYVKGDDTVGTITPDSVLLAVSVANNLQKEKAITIYPNPANKNIHLNFPNETGQNNFTIVLSNIYGIEIKRKDNLQNNSPIDISDLKPGVYFYAIQQNSKHCQTGKIIIY